MATLTLSNVQKSFGSNQVLRGIDLTVSSGQMICLIGASGSGKSTLLRCMNLLEPIDDGRIDLDGTDISEPGFDPQPVRQRIGMVFQSYNLFPHMTALENAMLAPRRIHRQSRVALEPAVTDLFTRFGLADRMGHFPDQLSGGQQQRVAIVRALAMRPEIMLFDEITSALDPELVGEVLDVLRPLRRPIQSAFWIRVEFWNPARLNASFARLKWTGQRRFWHGFYNPDGEQAAPKSVYRTSVTRKIRWCSCRAPHEISVIALPPPAPGRGGASGNQSGLKPRAIADSQHRKRYGKEFRGGVFPR
jgi:polar amino acid transport system ATP-binding protein